MQHVNTGFYYSLHTLSSVSNRAAFQRKSKLKKSPEGISDDSLFFSFFFIMLFIY